MLDPISLKRLERRVLVTDSIIFMPFSVTSIFAHHVAKKNSIKNFCFIDNNEKKQTCTYDGIKVLSPAEAYRHYPTAAVCVTSVVYSKAMKEQLGRIGFVNYIPFESISRLSIDLSEASEIRDEGITDKFPELRTYFKNPMYQIRQNLLPASISALENPTIVENMILSITEQCTLKCRDCANTMQYFKYPEHYIIKDIKRDIDRFFAAVDYVVCFGIVGGEPLLYPHITEVINYLGDYYRDKIGEVQIITNGMLRPKKELLEAMRTHRIRFFVSVYNDYSIKRDIIRQMSDEYGVECIMSDRSVWIDGGKIIDGEDRIEKEIQFEFEKCLNKLCRVLMNGIFTTCPLIGGATKLGAIPVNPENYVQLTENMPKNIIRDFLQREQFYPACRYCNGFRWGDGNTIPSVVQVKESLPYKKRA